MISESQGVLLEFLFKPKKVTYRLRNLSLKKASYAVTPNSKIIENSMSILTRVETQIFEIRRRKHEWLKLIRFLRYCIKMGINFFKFLLVFKVRFLMQYECMMSYNMSSIYVPHQKKRLAKYRWRTHSRWHIARILVVSSNETILRNHG
jgi:hypothetical protein